MSARRDVSEGEIAVCDWHKGDEDGKYWMQIDLPKDEAVVDLGWTRAGMCRVLTARGVIVVAVPERLSAV